MHLHVLHRFMVAWVGPFSPKTSLKNKWTFESRQNTYWNKPSAQITLYGCFGRLLQVEWVVQGKLSRVCVCVCVRSGAYEQDLQTLDVLVRGK